MGHSNPEMSLLYTEAELAYRRSAINLLEDAVFGGNNKVNLMDANGRELGVQDPIQSREIVDSKERACSSVG